ncbi:hypothetical protein E3E31_11470 [Thermococcus sp. M39]|uniref:DUF4097 family beta strand repeat-containing protein n=1 Tax=unclassified Thermococcus TaxID=2627626 RepID=UPI00143B9F2F|nr:MULTISPECIES: DUF4097 family beta strand repeat-containing protein [unclassified Thermococcus]NJE09132.1 hypothetical protein [Thermococcus sp. M39]NJE12081.1 hypothetical protein [Thermococcus sp. LS2]
MIEIVEREYEITDGLKLIISNVNGLIKINGYEGDTIKMKAEKKWGLLAPEPKIKVKKEGNILKIEAKYKKTFGISLGGSSVNFDILVPKTVEVEKVGSVNGKISISDVSGVIKIGNVNGSIELENVEVSKVGNVNGSIKALLRAVRNDVKISTVNGSIKVLLPRTTDATILASTTNGRILAEGFENVTTSSAGTFGPKSFSAQLGSGNYSVKLSTVNGSIEIRLI